MALLLASSTVARRCSSLQRTAAPLAWRSSAVTGRHSLTTSSSTSSSTSTSTSTSTASTKKKEPPESVYVHPLSQIVLLHFQSDCHEFITKAGLADNLQLQRDGTFSLTTTTTTAATDETAKEGGRGGTRIWTSYCPDEKRHWLSYSSFSVDLKFLLQDNMLPAWHGNKRTSLPVRIQASVQELIQAAERASTTTK